MPKVSVLDHHHHQDNRIVNHHHHQERGGDMGADEVQLEVPSATAAVARQKSSSSSACSGSRWHLLQEIVSSSSSSSRSPSSSSRSAALLLLLDSIPPLLGGLEEEKGTTGTGGRVRRRRSVGLASSSSSCGGWWWRCWQVVPRLGLLFWVLFSTARPAVGARRFQAPSPTTTRRSCTQQVQAMFPFSSSSSLTTTTSSTTTTTSTRRPLEKTFGHSRPSLVLRRPKGPWGLPLLSTGWGRAIRDVRHCQHHHHHHHHQSARMNIHHHHQVGDHHHPTPMYPSSRSQALYWEPPLSLRGGGASTLADQEDDDNQEEEEKDEEEEEEDDDKDQEQEVNAPTLMEQDDAEDEEKAPFTPKPSKSALTTSSVLVTVKTLTLGHEAVLDQAVELTVLPTRTVGSLKPALQRQLPGRPPLSLLLLKRPGQVVVSDEQLIQDLLPEDEDDDDDDEESAERSLVLYLDMIPPVDSQLFYTQLQQRLPDMSLSQLVDLYATNEAALYWQAQLLYPPPTASEDSGGSDPPLPLSSRSWAERIREQAERLRQEWDTSLFQNEESQKLLKDPKDTEPSSEDGSAASGSIPFVEVKGQRVRRLTPASLAATGADGAVTSWPPSSRALNIHWGDSIRNACLFLFFGWFGGRTPLSKAILLLGAPAVFLLQYRPVKRFIKQLVYTLLDHPPAIILSLLPAPQQAILSLDMAAAMKTLYGDHVVETGLDRIDLDAFQHQHDVEEDEEGKEIDDEQEEVGDDDDEEED